MQTSPVPEIVESFSRYSRKLHGLYDRIPEVTCRGRAKCCTLLPEMTFVEAASAMLLVTNMAPADTRNLLKRTALYFLLNPVRIMSCPFLQDGRCIIYKDRFLGCRTYGLWSEKYYRRMAAGNLAAKYRLRQVWASAGVVIPEEIAGFQIPYCGDVRVTAGKIPGDRMLAKLGRRLAGLSSEFDPLMHESFRTVFYLDFSFWLVSMALGGQGAAQIKFRVVRDMVHSGDERGAADAAESIADALVCYF